MTNRVATLLKCLTDLSCIPKLIFDSNQIIENNKKQITTITTNFTANIGVGLNEKNTISL